MGFADPIGRSEDIEAATLDLMTSLCCELEHGRLGARRLRLLLGRIDGKSAELVLNTSRPNRDAGHMTRLLAMRLDGLDVGFGIELIRLEIAEVQPLAAAQAAFAQGRDEAALGHLVDRLRTRLGQDRVWRPEPRQSHLPERAQTAADPNSPAETSGGKGWLAEQPRPLRLHERAQTVRAMARVPDGPPLRIGPERIVDAQGPERIENEWWNPAPNVTGPRDYWRVTTEEGECLWIYRQGHYTDPTPPSWHIHGRFQ
ncbi:MAG: hypothetical protein R3C97_06880 [Geminicoccaceae bacterium]